MRCARRGPWRDVFAVGRGLLARLSAIVASACWLACAHPLAYVPMTRCYLVPSEYVPGGSRATLNANAHSAVLRALGEPVLWSPRVFPPSVVRLSISSARDPLVVRIENRSGASPVVHASRFLRERDDCPGRYRWLTRRFSDPRSHTPLSEAEWNGVLALLRGASFEQTPLMQPSPAPGEPYDVDANATGYLLEMRIEGRYHAVFRTEYSAFAQSPGFRQLCERFVGLASADDVRLDAKDYCPSGNS